MKYGTLLIIGLIIVSTLSLGCFGFGEGYVKQAQKMTSADYVIYQYKFFIEKYNSVRQLGSMIVNVQRDMTSFKTDHGSPKFWTRSENDAFEDLRFAKNSYVQQYNGFVTEYNSRMRDITTNQVWMKPQGFPESLELYIEGKHVINKDDNQSLTMPNEIPSPPPNWIPPQS